MKLILPFPLIFFLLFLLSLPVQAQEFFIGGLIFNSSLKNKQNSAKDGFSLLETPAPPAVPAVSVNEAAQRPYPSQPLTEHQRRTMYQNQVNTLIRSDMLVLGQEEKKERRRMADYFFALLHQDPIKFAPSPSPKPVDDLDRSVFGAGITTFQEFQTGDIYRQDVLAFVPLASGVEQARPPRQILLEGITLNGNHFDMRKYRGKVVLVDFFAPWCRPCIEDFAQMKKLYELYHKKGFEVVSVGADNPLAIKELVEQQNLPWTIISDEMTVQQQLPSVMNKHGIMAIPTAYLIDPQGRLIDDNARGDRLEKLLEFVFSEKKEDGGVYYTEQ